MKTDDTSKGGRSEGGGRGEKEADAKNAERRKEAGTKEVEVEKIKKALGVSRIALRNY